MLLSYSRHRRRLRLPHPVISSSPVIGFLRSLSSVPIKPVAYPPKPKESQQIENQPSPPVGNQQPRRDLEPRDRLDSSPRESGAAAWVRRNTRFVKDVPQITPVAYPSVAPPPVAPPPVAPTPVELPSVASTPEKRPEAPKDAEGEVGHEELRSEERKIKSQPWVRSYIGLVKEEIIPFPTLIKLEKRSAKVPMDLTEAIRKVKENAKKSFLETVEAHVNLGVDPRRSDQMVRGALTLPHGTGKTVRIAVFAEGVAAVEAREAGADVVGGDELIEEIKAGGGKINFDKCIATPMFMPRLSKIGRILGPRGLMPNPKLGSVTNEVSEAIKAAKCGRIDFKIDKTAIVHVGLGKVNFTEENLQENIGAFVSALLVAKPVGLKKTSKYAGYVKNFTLSSTMGPGFPVTIQSLSSAADLYTKSHAK